MSSPEDSWDYGHRQVTPSDLDAVVTAIQTVLGATDPALDLPVEERWLAAIYGKGQLHSSNLREGLATSLALFGAGRGCFRRLRIDWPLLGRACRVEPLGSR